MHSYFGNAKHDLALSILLNDIERTQQWSPVTTARQFRTARANHAQLFRALMVAARFYPGDYNKIPISQSKAKHIH
jgi:hypothetical protein